MRALPGILLLAACASTDPQMPSAGLARDHQPQPGESFLFARLSLVPEGKWSVVLLVQHEETGERFLFPFKDHSELVCVQVPPGRYLLHGYEFARGSKLVEAKLDKPLRFDMPAGRVGYLGDHLATSNVVKLDMYQKDEFARWRVTLTIERISDATWAATADLHELYPLLRELPAFTCPPIRDVLLDNPAKVEIGPGDHVAVLRGKEVK